MSSIRRIVVNETDGNISSVASDCIDPKSISKFLPHVTNHQNTRIHLRNHWAITANCQKIPHRHKKYGQETTEQSPQTATKKFHYKNQKSRVSDEAHSGDQRPEGASENDVGAPSKLTVPWSNIPSGTCAETRTTGGNTTVIVQIIVKTRLIE